MSARAINATQVSDGGHQETDGESPLSLPPNDLSASQVNERPFVKLKVTRGKSDIVNSVVVNAAGQSLFSISSDSKRTTMIACKNNVEVATVEWNRFSPRMVFRRKKMKCKEWLPLAGPEKSRKLAHGDSQLIWMNKSSTSGHLIPANRSGLSVAGWHIKPHSDDLDLEIFQEALVESGLLEAIVVSVVLLRSGRSLGDTIETMTFSPMLCYLPGRNGW